jgi:hypothetical protein
MAAVDPELPTNLNMRMAPKVRYFLELAARLRSETVSAYIEGIIFESFKSVSLDSIDEDEPGTIKHPLSAQVDNLWSEHPIVRLQLMSALDFEHHMSKDEKAIWAYLFTRPDLFVEPGKMNRRLITDQWEAIKAQALGKDGAK